MPVLITENPFSCSSRKISSSDASTAFFTRFHITHRKRSGSIERCIGDKMVLLNVQEGKVKESSGMREEKKSCRSIERRFRG
ncbi:Uncharacterised protein [Chlamydia trachomatis]|nr:Uncharacterised protein [Chlamydia trachomatis]